jgi:hypothetical protein
VTLKDDCLLGRSCSWDNCLSQIRVVYKGGRN